MGAREGPNLNILLSNRMVRFCAAEGRHRTSKFYTNPFDVGSYWDYLIPGRVLVIWSIWIVKHRPTPIADSTTRFSEMKSSDPVW